MFFSVTFFYTEKTIESNLYDGNSKQAYNYKCLYKLVKLWKEKWDLCNEFVFVCVPVCG